MVEASASMLIDDVIASTSQSTEWHLSVNGWRSYGCATTFVGLRTPNPAGYPKCSYPKENMMPIHSSYEVWSVTVVVNFYFLWIDEKDMSLPGWCQRSLQQINVIVLVNFDDHHQLFRKTRSWMVHPLWWNVTFYLAIQRSVWRDIKFAFVFLFVFCLYGSGYLNAGCCDRREILAQGRANTRDGNEIVRGWSAHGGPWGGGLKIFWGEGTHFRE